MTEAPSKSLQYYHANRAPCIAKGRERRARNRAAYNASSLHWYHRVKETIDGRGQILFNSARARARKTGIQFEITRADVIELLQASPNCSATGLPLDYTPVARFQNPRGPSLDRMDATKGYVRGNVRVVCVQYNHAKSGWSEESILEFCRAVAARSEIDA